MRREASIFLVVGGLTVLLDFLVYRGWVWTGLTGTDAAKALGFLTGTVFAYFANRAWTFGSARHAAGSAPRFIVLYALTLGANVLVNAWMLAVCAGFAAAVEAAFLAATAVSATLNFIGMKFYVFRSAPAQGTS
jgi:putative flippase GtrA